LQSRAIFKNGFGLQHCINGNIKNDANIYPIMYGVWGYKEIPKSPWQLNYFINIHN
jgi:hypothetical protein